MKTLLIRTLIILIISIGIGLIIMIQYNTIKRLNKDLSYSYENIKAYSNELSGYEKTNNVYKLTIDQLNTYNDSILTKLNLVKNELKIKDRKISSLQYLEIQSTKIDSIYLIDTIFVKNYKLDTTIIDKWYSLELRLQYPNLIRVIPTFNDEFYIITHDRKETIKPAKKFFLTRWLQKKHNIRVVDLYNRSPYTKRDKYRFIEIIQ